MSRLAVVSLFVLAAACGGKPKTGSVEHAAPMGPDHAGRHEGGHPTMPAEVHGFHERLSPLWHAEAGAQRTADTCAAVAGMDEQLVAAETAAAPEGVDAAAWQARLGELRTQWGLLGADCAENQAGDFTARFTAAHDAFHALIELLPMANQ
ncbi:MAG: hypothetical protein KBG48_08235 [Kofleriaceae bacterium]|nr:hypothetical protein [Kofleriaceae bacterium]MBP9167360.1 hypothetical protein [Kofleriaceae bacterium]MBP9860777.1 hypothetical protein [Kofleriaceae bacterium]